tara:strand:- start:84 stop:899 length:816 start_codon:yes stop_codon:yes gene_type:complete
MVVLADRVKVYTSSTGTGQITLGSAVQGYQTFYAGGVVDGDTVRYVIEDNNNSDWEIGTGVYTHSGTYLSRTLTSSSTGSLLNLSGNNTLVFISPSSSDLILSSNAFTVNEQTASAGQTTFNVNYLVGTIEVFLNGVKLLQSDFTATSGTQVILDDACALDDKVEIVEYGIGNTNLSTFINTFTLPGSDGTNGQALITNGSGTLSFGDVSGSGGGGGATGGGTDQVFNENQTTVTTSYTLSTNRNAVSVGPITISTGATVTVPVNARWVVL